MFEFQQRDHPSSNRFFVSFVYSLPKQLYWRLEASDIPVESPLLASKKELQEIVPKMALAYRDDAYVNQKHQEDLRPKELELPRVL